MYYVKPHGPVCTLTNNLGFLRFYQIFLLTCHLYKFCPSELASLFVKDVKTKTKNRVYEDLNSANQATSLSNFTWYEKALHEQN